MPEEHCRVKRRDVTRNLCDGMGEMIERILATGGVELTAKSPKAIEFGDAGFVEVLKGLWSFRKPLP